MFEFGAQACELRVKCVVATGQGYAPLWRSEPSSQLLPKCPHMQPLARDRAFIRATKSTQATLQSRDFDKLPYPCVCPCAVVYKLLTNRNSLNNTGRV